ncbi:MAG: transcriptional repressor NrdR [Ruminococcaceae bacterium]|nr:transcriptional repressor NrdR [Oscillospiraceae bacterium]
MKCPVCGCCEDRVLDTRPIDEERSIRRRRECTNCLHRFTSYEIVESTPLVILKRDGSREEFNREKIMSGLKKACQKRPVTFQQMKDLVDRIEANLRNRQKGDVTTTEIGEQIMVGLRELDEVAYIRFVSVYRKFEDVESFLEELNNLKRLAEERENKEPEPVQPAKKSKNDRQNA